MKSKRYHIPVISTKLVLIEFQRLLVPASTEWAIDILEQNSGSFKIHCTLSDIAITVKLCKVMCHSIADVE